MGRSSCFSEKSVQVEEPVGLNPENETQETAEDTKGLCFLQESPLRIIRVAEHGNAKEFKQLISRDPSLLLVSDHKGRTAAHQAAMKNHIEILEIIQENNGSIDTLDEEGCSPLHIAINSEAVDSLKFLLQSGADASILNKKSQSPLHLAAQNGKCESLKALSKHVHLFDVNQLGEHGRTPLHLACIHDHFDCVKILIEDLHASPRVRCSHSFLPIHEAAKHGSLKALENLLYSGAKCGCPMQEMINFPDDEGNLALHFAVQSGDTKTVRLCLEAGAKISDAQKDLSTAVHLACAQGSMEIVKLMFTLQPEEKEFSLKSCDLERMTPLHYAAMFDHTELVEFLVQQNAYLNSLDKNKCTPLHLAASKNAWKTIKVLVSLGADTKIRDVNKRTVLHTIVKFNGDLNKIVDEETAMSFIPILEMEDKKGNTALHIATKSGQMKSVSKLLTLGLGITAKNKDGDTALHTACRFGRSKIIQLITQHDHFSTILNDSNNNGWTPVHMAAHEGHHLVLEILTKKGAFLRKDYDGRTPLHLAAANGHKNVVSLILNTHSHLIDMMDNEGNTSLHSTAIHNKPKVAELLLKLNCQLVYNHDGCSAMDLALLNKFVEVAYVFVTHKNRGDEIMGLTKGRHDCIMEALIAKMPSVAKAVLDSGIKKSSTEKSDSTDYSVEYNFKWLTKPGDCNGKNYRYLPILNEMVTYNRVGLLSHELSLKYLEMKWNAYGKFFQFTNLLFYLMYLFMVTYFTTSVFGRDDSFFARWKWFNEPLNNSQKEDHSCPAPEMINTSLFQYVSEEEYDYYEMEHPGCFASSMIFIYYGIALLTTFNVIVEIVNLCRHRIKYFDNFDTWVWIIMNLSCCFATCYPVYRPFLDEEQRKIVSDTFNPSLALAVFMGWFYLLLIMQRFDAVGLYVSMFLEILKTLFRVLIIFSVLILAFALSFFVLLSNGNHIVFSNIPMSIMRTFSMMLGDLDFMNTFLYPHHCEQIERHDKTNTRLYTTLTECTYPRRIPHPYATFPMVCVYMVFMPIVMINLLIGLAVGDIELVRNNAKLKRLSMQVWSHTNIEKIMPSCILRKVDKMSVVEYPNANKGISVALVKFFKHKEKIEDSDEMDIESDDLMEAILDNSVTLGQLTSDMDNVKTMIQLICTKFNVSSEINADEGAPADEINPIPEIRKGLRKDPVNRAGRRKLVRSDSSDSNN